MIRLKAILDRTDVDYNEKIFNTTAGIAGLGPNPFVSLTEPALQAMDVHHVP